jgi:hypothetical protein
VLTAGRYYERLMRNDEKKGGNREMKNPLRKNIVGFSLLAFLFSAFSIPPGISAQIEGKEMPQLEGPGFIWYSGDRGEKVWLDMGEVVVLPVPSNFILTVI